MKRLYKLAVLALPLMAYACSSPVPSQQDDEEDLGTAVSAATGEGVIDPFIITSFDIASGTMSGYDGDLEAYTGVFTGTTRFLRARIEQYQPGDPCRELAIAYNSARTIGLTTIYNAISDYVGCDARVRVTNDGTVLSFTPIPDQPSAPPAHDCDDDTHKNGNGKGHCHHGKGKGNGHYKHRCDLKHD